MQVALSAAALALLVAAMSSCAGARGVRSVPFARGGARWRWRVTLLQFVPLPAALVRAASRRSAHELRAEVAPRASLMPLTLDAPATWLALRARHRLHRAAPRGRRAGALVAARAAPPRLVAGGRRGPGDHRAGVQRLARRTRRSSASIRRARSRVSAVFGTFVDVNHAASVLLDRRCRAIGLAVELRDGARAAALRRLRRAVGLGAGDDLVARRASSRSGSARILLTVAAHRAGRAGWRARWCWP